MSRSKRRFAVKLDYIFWLIVMLFPMFVYLISIRQTTDGDFSGFFTLLSSEFYAFEFIADKFTQVFEVFGVGAKNVVVYYLSYCVMVELAHVFFDFVVFIPRLAHKWVSKAVQDD